MAEDTNEGLTGFQSWFLTSCHDTLKAEVTDISGTACVLIGSKAHPTHATIVVAPTDEATRTLFDALPTFAATYDTIDVVMDGRAWTMGTAPLLVPELGRPGGASDVTLRTTRSALYPEEMPYTLPLLTSKVTTDAGVVSLGLWPCLRWDAETLMSVRYSKTTGSALAWLEAVMSRPQVSRILRACAVDLTGNVVLDAHATFAAKAWAEALWQVR